MANGPVSKRMKRHSRPIESYFAAGNVAPTATISIEPESSIILVSDSDEDEVESLVDGDSDTVNSDEYCSNGQISGDQYDAENEQSQFESDRSDNERCELDRNGTSSSQDSSYCVAR